MLTKSTLATLNQDDPATRELEETKLTATDWEEQLVQATTAQDEWPISFDGEHQLDDATGMTSWQGGW